jgi:hypothetical protein
MHMTIDQRRLQLIGWIEIIKKDVEGLVLDQYIFYELQKIVRENPRFAESPGLFTRWMASGFAQASAVGIRRQARYDKRYPDNISLLRFLNEVKDNPDLITRQYYLELYKAKNAPVIIGENDFNTLAGAGNDQLPPARIDKHIDELKSAADAVAIYVNRRIAHHDERVATIPTFGDLSAALATMEKLVLLYVRLLKGDATMQLLPTFSYDWTSIFRFAWLNPDHSD